MSTDINLLLHTDEELLRRQKKAKIFNLIAFSFLIGIGLISLFIFLVIQAVNIPLIRKEQDDIRVKISKLQSKQVKLFIINNRASNIQTILDQRKDLSSIMSILLAKTPPRLLIEDMEISNKVIVIAAQSTSLFSIGEFINNLTDMVRKKEIISSLTLNNLIFSENSNSYKVTVKAEL